MELPGEIYTAAQVRQLEQAVIAAGTPGYTLMQRAGAAAFAALRRRWPDARVIAVVAGPGNNGGDGLVLARLAHQSGLPVWPLLVGDVASLRGEAAQAHADLRAAGLDVQPFDAALLSRADLVVDALLGIGMRQPLKPEWEQAVLAMARAGCPVFSLDLPSGLDPDSGRGGTVVPATATICLLAMKQGLLLGEGPEHAGELLFDDVQVDAAQVLQQQPAMRRLQSGILAQALRPRARASHKSQFGRVLIIGGGTGMPGAVRLAGEAALRVGAGLVTVASLPEHLLPVVGARPELMFRAVREEADLLPLLSDADVVAIGPGLGRDAWARAMLQAVLAHRRGGSRLVLDADALNLLAQGAGSVERCDDWVLTPHPGEAARLLGISAQQVQADRSAALRALCRQRGGVIVLKGAATLVGSEGDTPGVCTLGNPGMSVPGMGDVLTGAVAGMLAQGASARDAAEAAVYAHAAAGDLCARAGVRGMLAGEVAQALRGVLAHLR